MRHWVWPVICCAGCAASKAPAAETPVEPIADAQQEQLEVLKALDRHQQDWRREPLQDYVFALDRHRSSLPLEQQRMRVVVKAGKITSATSLDYPGAPALDDIPTLEMLFVQAAQVVAAARADGKPAPHVTFDAKFGYVASLRVAPTGSSAPDQASFSVPCFSLDEGACRPRTLTQDQCNNAGATHIASGPDATCRGGWSIGLVTSSDVCCRTYSEGTSDEMGAERCGSAGGHAQVCADNELLVGANQQTGQTCCRPFVE